MKRRNASKRHRKAFPKLIAKRDNSFQPQRRGREPARQRSPLRTKMSTRQHLPVRAPQRPSARSERLRTRLPADPHVLSELRRLVNDLLAAAGVPEPARQDALLVAHELTANAIEHGSRANDEIGVRCSLEGRRLRIAVFDNARKHSIPVAYTPQGESARGHGL
jgi:hypothetical protein